MKNLRNDTLFDCPLSMGLSNVISLQQENKTACNVRLYEIAALSRTTFDDYLNETPRKTVSEAATSQSLRDVSGNVGRAVGNRKILN